MPQFKNLGYGTLSLQLSEEKQITLGPRETKDISADESKSAGIHKALAEGLIAVLPGDVDTRAETKTKKGNQN